MPDRQTRIAAARQHFRERIGFMYDHAKGAERLLGVADDEGLPLDEGTVAQLREMRRLCEEVLKRKDHND